MAEFFRNEAHRVADSLERIGRTGQIAPDTYLAVHPTEAGTRVILVLNGEAAPKVAENPAVRCVVLERSPLLRGRENAVTLRIDEGDPEWYLRTEVVYPEGKGPVFTGSLSRLPLTETVLGNLANIPSAVRR